MPILTTKLYIPPLRPNAVVRPRLIERLHEGLHGKLTLISAPAGFGKTTLLCTRTHTKNIYDKLGVNNRRAAVHRAEEMKLL